jgi:beta-lactam-binding protein with PASTA domain
MPARTFAITADNKPVTLDASGTGELTINVSNTSAKPIRGAAKLVPMGTTKQEWFHIRGEVERNFSAHEAQQFVVRITAPPLTPSGRYSLRLNVMSVQNPDDDYAEGPVVSFEVHETKAVPPRDRKEFPWFYFALTAIVIAGGLAPTLLLRTQCRVPNLKDKTVLAVMEEVTAAGLKLTNVTVELFDETTNQAGRVFQQTPNASTKLKKGSGVAVRIAQLTTNTTRVPPVLLMTLDRAVETLITNNLAVTTPKGLPPPPDFDVTEIVWSQSPTGLELVQVFTKVTLGVTTWDPVKLPDTGWVALARPGGFAVIRPVEVPRLLGMALPDVTNTLAKKDLAVSRVEEVFLDSKIKARYERAEKDLMRFQLLFNQRVISAADLHRAQEELAQAKALLPYGATNPPGTVVVQRPLPEAKVKSGTGISVSVLSLGVAPPTKVRVLP